MQTLLCVALTEHDMHYEEESTKQGTEHKLMVKKKLDHRYLAFLLWINLKSFAEWIYSPQVIMFAKFSY